MKSKSINLSFPHPRHVFDPNWNPPKDATGRYVQSHPDSQIWRVERVVNSIEFNPGQYLLRAQVDELCASAAWTVTTSPVKL